jgi:U4/U6 small nuclear ribonucleoprotein PRP4
MSHKIQGSFSYYHLFSVCSETPVSALDCQTDRVVRVAYHPSGKFLGAACFDCSWRLWDLSSEREVLHQVHVMVE